MTLYAIKKKSGGLYKPKKHGVKVYTRYQDAKTVNNTVRGTIVSYKQEFV